MALHPGEAKRHFPQEASVPLDSIRRVLEADPDWYRDLVDHSRDLFCTHDLEGRFLSINPIPARLLGYTIEEMMCRPMREFAPPQYRARFDDYLREIAITGEASGLMSVVTKSGEERIWEYNNTLCRDGVQVPVVRGIAHDVTDRVRAEEALTVTNDRLLRTTQEQGLLIKGLTMFRALLDHSNDSIIVIDPPTLRLLDVNDRACIDLGYSREELLTMTIRDIDPDLTETWRAQMDRQLRESGFAIMERMHRRKDGTTFPVEVNLRNVKLERSYGVAISRDITERKRVESALRETRARELNRGKELEMVLDVVPVPVFITHDAQCRRITGNRAAYEQMRLPRGTNFSKSGPPAEQPAFRTMRDGIEIPADHLPMQLAVATQEPVYGCPVTLVFGDGTERETVVNAVPLLDEHGNPAGSVAASIDLTELKRAEKALRESELLFRTVYERSPMGIALVDSQSGSFLQVNPKFCEISGRTEDELRRLTIQNITDPRDLDESVESLQRLAAGERTDLEFQKRYVRPDGSVRWVRILPVPMWTAGETRRWHMSLVQDITERRQAEEAQRQSDEALRRSEQQYRMLFEKNLAGVAIASSRGQVLDCNDAWARILGYDRADEVRGRNAKEFYFDLADREALRAQLQEKGSMSGREIQLRRKDGAPVWVLFNGVVISNTDGEPLFQATAIDITEHKRAEKALRESEERFRVALKHSPITVFNQDRDLRYTWSYNSLLAGNGGEVTGKTTYDLLDAEEGHRSADVRRRVLETGVGARHQVQADVGGVKRYFDVTIEPLFDATNSVIGLTGATMDVSELREATEALREAKKKLTEEKFYLEQEIDTELGFGEIIGQSKPLQHAMEQVGRVASSDATVLLLGETGTGKELVARAVHRLSSRANSSFIKLNCAAIPSGLLESELFGYEKGAFTGAISKKIGRLELADKGTLFLDEIGEISLELQPKLLRVLQDQEFERLGSTQTLKVNFRLIAATNRNLADLVRDNQFRSDLYYRLNVFPISVPPLRERREDIPLLVEHFVQKFAQRMKKSITSIPTKTMDALIGWGWPGNVRELENFIERSVILTQGSVLVAPSGELVSVKTEKKPLDEKTPDQTLAAAERFHILRALQASHGQIGGIRGAARRLGLKRTTLQSKLKHLGIDPRSTPLGR
jgi:formate hydrogenlyase transcriptional activator